MRKKIKLQTSMMKHKIEIAICLTITVITLSFFYVQSTDYFRLKLADKSMRSQDYDKSIYFYKKILRKNRLIFERKNPLAFWSGLFLKGRTGQIRAIESISSQLRDAYFRNAGRHHEQIKLYSTSEAVNLALLDKIAYECDEISRHYRDYVETFGYASGDIEARWQEIMGNAEEEKIKLCFSVGEQYIEKEMWDDARIFYTRDILKYMNPIAVLKKLHNLYGNGARIKTKEKIWGNNIYVLLEDFEDPTRLSFKHWISKGKFKVNEHSVTRGVSYQGSYSEHFNISYKNTKNKKIYDYWIMPVELYLDSKTPPIGIRAFFKSREPFGGYLRLNVSYGNNHFSTAPLYSQIGARYDEGWIELKIDDIFKKIERWVHNVHKWDIKEARVDKVTIDTSGITNSFYVDNIQLYILPSGDRI